MKQCNTCRFFKNALDEMTDHINYHFCACYDFEIFNINVAEECTMYKVIDVNR